MGSISHILCFGECSCSSGLYFIIFQFDNVIVYLAHNAGHIFANNHLQFGCSAVSFLYVKNCKLKIFIYTNYRVNLLSIYGTYDIGI